jgi:hypothetical protein
MTTPTSRPSTPAQPDLDSYGFNELALFKSYTRESYLRDFGAQAPAYDPNRVTKTWFDSTADTSDPDNVSTYKVFQGVSGQWMVKQLVLPSREAGAVNLPGAIDYPKYVIAPTTATFVGDPVLLSLRADADVLLRELGLAGTPLVDAAESMIAFKIDYKDDDRRMWQFVYKGDWINVGALLANKNAHGIGWPGHWEVGTAIRWVADPPAPTGLDDRRPARPMPVRDLLSNEKIDVALFGGPQIFRTDRQQQKAESSGQFLESDRALLREILRLVQPRA